MQRIKTSNLGALYGFLAVFFFLVSHSQVKVLSHFSVPQVVLIRALGILVFAWPYLFWNKISVWGVDKKNLLLRGMFGSIALFSYFLSLQNLPLSTAVVLQQLAPFFAIFIAKLFLKEPASLYIWIFFAVAFFGVHLIKAPNSSLSWYHLLGINAAFFAALAYNCVRHLRISDHPLVVMSYFQLVLLVFVGGAVFLGYFSYLKPVGQDVFPILFLVFFSFLAQVCLTLSYHHSHVSKAISFNFLAVPLSAVVGLVFFNEPLSLQQWVGVILVFGGQFLFGYVKRTKEKHSTKAALLKGG